MSAPQRTASLAATHEDISLVLPAAVVRRIADRVREEVLAELRAATEPAGYLAPQAAADYLGVTRRRVHDLTSMRAIVPDGRDGRTPLYKRETLDSYAQSSAR